VSDIKTINFSLLEIVRAWMMRQISSFLELLQLFCVKMNIEKSNKYKTRDVIMGYSNALANFIYKKHEEIRAV
jgi:hypothetical protein